MLSLKTLTSGDTGDYYLRSVPDGPEQYYLAEGSESRWLGDGAARLSRSGPVRSEDFRRVLAGIHPGDGSPLARGRAAAGGRTPGYDLTFSPPKSVTLLAVLSHPAIGEAVRAAHRHAVDETMRLVELEVVRARRGSAGSHQLSAEVIAAAFEHHTSRAVDPQLHTHVVVANVGFASDGRWSALHGQRLYGWAKTAGTLYQAALRTQLSENLGVIWTPVQRGTAEVVGFNRQQLEAFSTRRSEIVAELDRIGQSSARAAQLASWDTRAAKTHIPDDVFIARWRARAEEIGLTPEVIGGLVGTERSTKSQHEVDQLIDQLLGATGLTANASTFDRRHVLEAVAAAHDDGLSVKDAAALADRTLDDPRTISLPEPSRLGDRRHSTAELMAIEADLLARAERQRRAGQAVVTSDGVAQALNARPALSEEQRRMVEQLLSSGAGVEVVVGRAGAGKTFALDAARAGWESSGRRVIGAALAARAAAELQAGAGIPSTTLDRLLLDAEQPGRGGGLPTAGVVVVDESGMVGTRKLGRLLALAERSGTKVILVGDPRQLPEIEAGGAFAALTRALPALELVANRRQIESWERAALADLRSGEVVEAVATYGDHDRLTLASDADTVRQRLVDDWWQARSAGQDAAMYALRRSDVDDLNSRARQHLMDAGLLGADPLVVGNVGFAVGDDVLALRNDRRLGIHNGTRGQITAVDHDARNLTITTGQGSEINLPAAYLDAGHVSHSYATTIHKAQGSTVERAFLLGSDTLYREAGYVGLSRARTRTDLYIVAPTRRQHPPALEDSMARLAGQLLHSRAQHLATPVDPTATVDTGASIAELERQRDQLRQQIGAPPEVPFPNARSELTSAHMAMKHAEERLARAERSPRRHRSAARSMAQQDADIASARRDRAEQAWQLHDDASTARQDWSDINADALARYQEIISALGRRELVIEAAALADPGSHLIEALGTPPVAGPDRDRCAACAAAIDSYRERWCVADNAALGPAADRPDQGRQRRRLEHEIARHNQALDRHLDQGMEL